MTPTSGGLRARPFTSPPDTLLLRRLRSGDMIDLSGDVITARDAACRRFDLALREGGAPPVDLAGQLVFYAGPCPAPPGRIIGPVAATTAARMDGFLETLFRLGVPGTIGKGERSEDARRLCRDYGGVYFLSVGGAAALIARRVSAVEELAYADLGTESVKKLRVENLRLVVGIDSRGRVFQPGQIDRYRLP